MGSRPRRLRAAQSEAAAARYRMDIVAGPAACCPSNPARLVARSPMICRTPVRPRDRRAVPPWPRPQPDRDGAAHPSARARAAGLPIERVALSAGCFQTSAAEERGALVEADGLIACRQPVPRMMADSRSAMLLSPRAPPGVRPGPSPERVSLARYMCLGVPVRVVHITTLRD